MPSLNRSFENPTDPTADEVENEFYLTRAQAVRTTFKVILAIEFFGGLIHIFGASPATRTIQCIAIAANLIFFVALWWWSGRRPLAASLTGLIYILGMSALAALADPSTLFHGIVVRILVLAALFKGVRDGLAHRHFERLVKRLD